MKVLIFTDGAARGNPDGPGGYAAVLRIRNAQGETLEKELSGGYPHTTNNRMELMAVIAALEEVGRLGEPCEGLIYSDSRYVVDAFSKNWITNWKKNGWVTASRTPVKNQDLWTRLLHAMEPHRFSFRWVKGHADHPENERCDRLATAAADKVGWDLNDTAQPFTQTSEWYKAGTASVNKSKTIISSGGTLSSNGGRPSTADTPGSGAESFAGPLRNAADKAHSTAGAPDDQSPKTIQVRYFSDRIEKLQPPTNSANWVDLRSAEDVVLKQGEFRLISLGVAMKLPEGYEAHIVPRSSTYKNFGIIQANHHGVVDNAYSGDNDLWRMPVIAMRDTEIHVNDRICQFRIERRQPDIIFEEVKHLDDTDRGGFGSTGVQ